MRPDWAVAGRFGTKLFGQWFCGDFLDYFETIAFSIKTVVATVFGPLFEIIGLLFITKCGHTHWP